MTTRRGFLAGSLGCALVWACGDDDGGSRDAGRRDLDAGGRDLDAAGRDAGAARDAATRDAARDAARDTGVDADAGVLPICAAVSAAIATNHRGAEHVLEVPVADVLAGEERAYDITGFGDHPHTLTVTAADFATLRESGRVEVRSSTDDRHDHVVTLRCS